MAKPAFVRSSVFPVGVLAVVVAGAVGLGSASSSTAESAVEESTAQWDAAMESAWATESDALEADVFIDWPQAARVKTTSGAAALGQGVVVPGLATSVPIDSTTVALAPDSTDEINVRSGPSEHTPVSWRLGRIDEFGQVRVFRVLEQRGSWLRVQVPVRPNGSEGWIYSGDVDVEDVTQRMVIDLSERSVVVWDGDDVVLDTTGAIGRPDTPTPTGSFYVRNVFPWDPDSVYGPWVLPLSAFSETIDQINGGDAVVAIHGTQRPDQIGQDVSLGCIRLSNETVSQLAALVPAGTPVEIVP